MVHELAWICDIRLDEEPGHYQSARKPDGQENVDPGVFWIFRYPGHFLKQGCERWDFHHYKWKLEEKPLSPKRSVRDYIPDVWKEWPWVCHHVSQHDHVATLQWSVLGRCYGLGGMSSIPVTWIPRQDLNRSFGDYQPKMSKIHSKGSWQNQDFYSSNVFQGEREMTHRYNEGHVLGSPVSPTSRNHQYLQVDWIPKDHVILQVFDVYGRQTTHVSHTYSRAASTMCCAAPWTLKCADSTLGSGCPRFLWTKAKSDFSWSLSARYLGPCKGVGGGAHPSQRSGNLGWAKCLQVLESQVLQVWKAGLIARQEQA